MKQTLLEIVQEVLESMESDSVNSISDTSEATTVAHIVRRAYWDMIGRLDPPEHYTLFELDATTSSTPVMMTIPTEIVNIGWVKYNNATTDDPDPNFKPVAYLDLSEFLDRSLMLRSSETNVDTFDKTIGDDSVTFLYTNDAFPTYYTTFDDNTILFNSFFDDYDTNLQKTKTMCYGLSNPTFTLSDSFTPDLDARQFPLLVNEAKALAFAELKQVPHEKAERNARRLWISSQRTKRGVFKRNELDFLPNYGRK